MNEKLRSSIFLVNNTSALHDDVKFIFSTLWSKISQAKEYQIQRAMNDFHVIKYNGYPLSIAQYNQLHADSLAFLKKNIVLYINTIGLYLHDIITNAIMHRSLYYTNYQIFKWKN